jgi:excisionase family DNA binding protein
LILGIQRKIAEHLKHLDRTQTEHPSPRNTEELLNPKLPDTLSIGEVAKCLGEKIHNVRRMANQGILPSKLSLGGHRRFPKEAILRLAKERENS